MGSLGTNWRKSSRSSSNGDCVEARKCDDRVELRDSKDRSGPVLSFPASVWQAFINDAKADQF